MIESAAFFMLSRGKLFVALYFRPIFGLFYLDIEEKNLFVLYYIKYTTFLAKLHY